LYRSVYQDVPTDYYTIPFGKATLLHKGKDLSIITYGAGVHWALNEVKEHPISVDIIDLRTLQPLDTEAIYKSVKKTGKALILHEDTLFGGIASDLSALITENCFNYLDAPVKRLGSLETPIPFAKSLEAQFLPKNRLHDSIIELINY